tara:strand:+ start:3379 stop:4404 length:1026 start_codon:yes stop_codon:yes gene_type:complete
MAITSNSIDILGVAVEPILTDILFENNTINKGLVTFESDVKAETIFTEASATATMQQYTDGVPTSTGDLSTFDAKVTPTKVLFYQEFIPANLRFSRYKRSMPAGAYNNFSTEFERIVIGGVYASKISLSAEKNYWLGATAATKTAIAALTAGAANTSIGTEEKALVASSALGISAQFDGVLTKVLYNNSRASGAVGVGERLKVVGTTITAANIKAEYDKVYAAIPAEVLESGENPIIYAPYSHKQLITIFNNNVANFKDAFAVSGNTFAFNGIVIEFVPLPENVILCAKKSHLFWVTDLTSDINTMKMDKIANNREDMFLKSIMSIGAHVGNQKFNVLYVG